MLQFKIKDVDGEFVTGAEKCSKNDLEKSILSSSKIGCGDPIEAKWISLRFFFLICNIFSDYRQT